ncbi:MAG TPA: stalk domain-containing protein [Candidatus Deferrimicrobium sp.]|nr:stalk domain-containing protein [Candidatus Deferrimicrobium sp.]
MRLSNRSIVLVLVVAILLSLSVGPGTALGTPLGVNPPVTYIRASLKAAALRYNVPSVILMAIAYQETGWRQFDANGNTVTGSDASSVDMGIMQINSSGRTDVARLMTDIDYNIDTGAKMLDGKWKLTPGIGDRDRNVLENWYYAIWAYNGFSSTNNPNTLGGRHFQDSILALMARQVLGSDGQPLWPPVAVTPPSPALVVSPVGWIPTPQPVHYGDLYGGFNPGNPVGVLQGPADPGALAAAGEIGQVRITWSPSTAGSYTVLRYDIYRSQGAPDIQKAELVAETKPDATQFVDIGPLQRTAYYYWVLCEDIRGDVSNPVGPVGAQPIIMTSPITKITLVFTLDKPAVVMNGVTVPMETAPVIENGRTILPIRYVATPLGTQVLWNSKEQKVTLLGSKKVELWIGKPQAMVDGVGVLIDPANPLVIPRINGGRTMLPLRFVGETFGAEILYDQLLRTVTITLNKTT